MPTSTDRATPADPAPPRLDLEVHDRAGFQAAVQSTMDAAITRSARTLWWVDRDFADWPLDRPALIAALSAWLHRPLRRLVLLAEGFEAMERAHPRFSAWRRDWTHAVDPRVRSDADRGPLPTLLIDDGPVVLELWQSDPPRGRAAADALAARTARERIDATLQRSTPDWPLRPLGF
ncbi:MAG: hypothetical protein ABIX12_12915 [Rubrivivax sp.]